MILCVCVCVYACEPVLGWVGLHEGLVGGAFIWLNLIYIILSFPVFIQ